MYHTVNTKIQSFTREEAISPNRKARTASRGGRAPYNISDKHQAIKASSLKPKRQASSQASSLEERQAIFFGCGANRQAPSMAFRGGRIVDLGSRSFDKV